MGISASSVVKIWHEYGLASYRWRSFKLSNEKAFDGKLHDVVGHYVSSMEHPATPPCKVAVSSEHVAVVDTLGGRDIFDAGVLASLKRDNLLTKTQVASLDERALPGALLLAAKAAAITVSRAGANLPPGCKIRGTDGNCCRQFTLPLFRGSLECQLFDDHHHQSLHTIDVPLGVAKAEHFPVGDHDRLCA